MAVDDTTAQLKRVEITSTIVGWIWAIVAIIGLYVTFGMTEDSFRGIYLLATGLTFGVSVISFRIAELASLVRSVQLQEKK